MVFKIIFFSFMFLLSLGCSSIHVNISSNKDTTYQGKIKKILITIPPNITVNPIILKNSFLNKFNRQGIDAHVLIVAPLELDEKKVRRDAILKFRPTQIMDLAVKSISRTTYGKVGTAFHSGGIAASKVTFEIIISDRRTGNSIWRSNVEFSGSEYSSEDADELASKIVEKLQADGLLTESGADYYNKATSASGLSLSPPVIPDRLELTVLTKGNIYKFLSNILVKEDINAINLYADKFFKEEGNITYTIRDEKQKVLILLRIKNNKRTGCFVKLSDKGYPVIPISVFSEKIRPSKVDKDKLNQWFRRMSQEIATNGKSTSLIVFENGNSLEVELTADPDNIKILYYDKKFMKKGTFDGAGYLNILTGGNGDYGETVTKYQGKDVIDMVPSIP